MGDLGRGHRPSTEKTGYRLFWSAEALILDLPVSSQVRAGAYRMLAGVDGLRLVGPATDQRGRAGLAVAYQRGANQDRLIVDPATGQALALEAWHGGTLMHYTVIEEGRYTDDKPA